eukprot:gene6556-9005_t
MNKADEKKAFEDMMAEISDSDDENDKPGANSRVMVKNNNANNSYNNNHTNLKDRLNSDSDSKKFPDKSNQAAAGSKSSNNSGYKQSSHGMMSKEEQEIENFGVNTSQQSIQVASEQVSITKRWLQRPCSRNERSSMKCYVERDRTGFGMQTIYRCYLEGNDSNQSSSSARFMMSAKKKVTNKTSYYLLSLDLNPDDDRGSESVLGKVRGNSIGSRYLITDHGLPPDKTVAPSMLRKEFGVVSFEFDSGGPSRIESWIPYVNHTGTRLTHLVTYHMSIFISFICLMETKIDEKDFDRMIYLQNKTPKWDEAHGGHVLNFQGRVTESSVKNFQLCCTESESPEDIILQFGRVGKHKFTMDLKFPLSPIQAFSICVACLDGKIADRKGYEYIRKITGSSVVETSTSGAPLANNNMYNEDKDNAQAKGSMSGGSASITDMFREALPNGQYLRDKINRKFK